VLGVAKRRHLLLAAFVASGTAAAFISAGQSQSAPGAAAALPSFAQTAVQRVATINGEPTPTQAQWVETTRQVAVASQSSDGVDSDQNVYFVILHGQFVDTHAYMPPGASAPTGTVLTMTVDASTGEVLDSGLSDIAPNYTDTGTPAAFSLQSG
jgi:hypothetical protein